MNKVIGLRFLIQYGQFFQVILPEDTAKNYIALFQAKSLPPVIGGHDLNGSWAIASDKILGIHTVPIQSNQGAFGVNSSGL